MSKITLFPPRNKDVALDWLALQEYFQRNYPESGVTISGDSPVCIKNTNTIEDPWHLELFFLPAGAGVHVNRALNYVKESNRKLNFGSLYCLLQRIYGEDVFQFITTSSHNGVVVTVNVAQGKGFESIAIFSGKRTVF